MDILMVEDNPADVRLLKELMAEQGHAPNIHWVMDGHEALDYVFQRNEHKSAAKPDMVLLDLGLPRISGYEVLKEIKEDGRFGDLPVVVLTTSRNPLDQNQCKSLGADSFLSKPRNLKGFEELAQQLVGMHGSKVSEAI